MGRELGKRVPWPERHEYKQAPPPFDFERMVRFMAYPFIMAPLQHRWFGFLNTRFPVGAGSGGGTMNAFRRVAFDQLLFAPCGLAAFFAFMTIAEGGGHREVKKVPGRLYSGSESELYRLAGCSAHQFPAY